MDIENYKAPKIIALEIDEFDEDSGVDAIALVAEPAIESDWFYFSKNQPYIFQSYTDYPKAASENAQRALNWVEKNGWGSCGTNVGKQRAHQLAKGEPISEDTIARMAAFERHRRNSKTPYGEGCGKLMWDAWGGDEGIEWAQRKLKQIREELDIDVSDIGDYIPTGSDIIPKDSFNVEEYLDFYFELVDYIDGLPLFTTKEEAEKVADMIGCEGTHEHEIEGFVFYMPCADHDEATEAFLKEVEELLKKRKKKYLDDLPQELQDKILDKMLEVGESEEEMKAKGWELIEEEQKFAISSAPNEPSIEDYGRTSDGKIATRIRYRYTGPNDGKTRNFCKRLLNANLVFRKEDINNMTLSGENSEFGVYDIFTYKGSYGCRHNWVRLTYRRADTGHERLTVTEADDAATSVNAKPTMNRNPNSDTLISNDINQSNFSEIQKEKKLIAGPLMIPRKLIYRWDELNGEYFVYFSESTIEKIAYKYMIQKNQDKANLEHVEGMKLEDVILVESWLVEEPDKDKSFALTGQKYEKGTWFGIMRVLNESVWQDWVKTGRVAGFSVEGFFSDKLINASKHSFYLRTTKGGTEIVIDHKTLVVFILKDGERSAILQDGTYELTNGQKLIVKDSKAIEGSF